MSSEYNSKLIAKLYLVNRNNDELKRVLNEMEEIGDPVFIYPIFESWKIHNFDKSLMSHYFISSLKVIDSEDVLKIGIQILGSSTTVKDMVWTFPIFSKYNYFEEKPIFLAKKIIEEFSKLNPSYALLDFTFSGLLRYLKEAKVLNTLEDTLRTIVLNEKIDYECRREALYFLLRSNTKEFSFFLENYGQIKTDDIDILLAKEAVGWKGSTVQKLRDLLSVKGNDRARDIINLNNEQKEQEENKKNIMELSHYDNVQVISDIVELRRKINSILKANASINFAVLEEGENIIKQQEIVIDREGFNNRCIGLRELFKGVSGQAVTGFSEKEKSVILPGLSSEYFNKPLNRLVLFLHEKGIKVEIDLFGLRPLNKLVNLALHPEEEKKFINAIKGVDLYELFKKEQWREMHTHVLVKYKKSLSLLLEKVS